MQVLSGVCLANCYRYGILKRGMINAIENLTNVCCRNSCRPFKVCNHLGNITVNVVRNTAELFFCCLVSRLVDEVERGGDDDRSQHATPMMAMTTISSTSVKPFLLFLKSLLIIFPPFYEF